MRYESGDVAARVAINTAMAPGASAVTGLFLSKFVYGYYDVSFTINSLLAGLVAVTGGCSSVDLTGAFIIGVIAPFVYWLGHVLLLKWQIDDPVDAAPVHAFNGVWGMVATGLFAQKEHMAASYGKDFGHYGLFYGGDGTLLATQLIACLAIIGWSAGTALLCSGCARSPLDYACRTSSKMWVIA